MRGGVGGSVPSQIGKVRHRLTCAAKLRGTITPVGICVIQRGCYNPTGAEGRKIQAARGLWTYLDPHIGICEVNFGHKDESSPRVGVNNGAEQAR